MAKSIYVVQSDVFRARTFGGAVVEPAITSSDMSQSRTRRSSPEGFSDGDLR